jgi:hypothetical protein
MDYPAELQVSVQHSDMRAFHTNIYLLHMQHNVICRPVAGQRLGKHIPATNNT